MMSSVRKGIDARRQYLSVPMAERIIVRSGTCRRAWPTGCSWRLVFVSWITAESGCISWHKLSGYGILSFVVFRIYWGCLGSTTARFSHFLRGPGQLVRYPRHLFNRSKHSPTLGYNPAGVERHPHNFSLFLQAGTGLFVIDDYGTVSGPFSNVISFKAARSAIFVT